MPTYRLAMSKFAILREREITRNDHTSATFKFSGSKKDQVLIAFNPLEDSHKLEEITSIKCYIFGDGDSSLPGCWGFISRSDFNENTANFLNSYKNFPGYSISSRAIFDTLRDKDSVFYGIVGISSMSDVKMSLEVAKNTLVLGETLDYLKIYLATNGYEPYFEITTTGTIITDISLKSMSPSGRVNRHGPVLFSWSLTDTHISYEGERITAATLKWRQTGSSTWHSVSASAEKYNVTIPANTFSSGTVEWKVDVTLNNGFSFTSEVQTIDTTEPTPTATINFPDNTIINASENVTLSWNYSVETGSPQGAYEIQKSTDGVNWSSFVAKTTSPNTEYTAVPGTITSGDFYWRVKVYNNDNVASDWVSAHAIAIAAPSTPIIQFTDVSPKIKFRWETTEQQGYQIRIDGEVVKSQYGTDSSDQYDGWLTDGSHTVEVRVQNSYGIWSAWGTATVTVRNVPGTAVTLTASGNSLSWTSGYDKYAVYRNNSLIAITEETYFRDVFANGNVSYFVRGYDDGSGNYTLSNSVSVTVSYENLTIFDTETGETVDLGRSAKQTRQINVTIAKDVTFNHYSGHAFPVAERGISVDRRCNFEFAFLSSDPARSDAEEIIGHTVILLNPYGESIVGVISDIRKTEDEFICSYSATLTKTEYSEVEINARL